MWWLPFKAFEFIHTKDIDVYEGCPGNSGYQMFYKENGSVKVVSFKKNANFYNKKSVKRKVFQKFFNVHRKNLSQDSQSGEIIPPQVWRENFFCSRTIFDLRTRIHSRLSQSQSEPIENKYHVQETFFTDQIEVIELKTSAQRLASLFSGIPRM